MKPEDAARIDAIASQAMGVEPQAAAPEAAPANQAQPAQDTPEGKAAEAGSPETEGDKISDNPVVYSVDLGDGKTRDLTPQQIRSTFDRYAALNHRHAQNKPLYDVMDAIIEANPNADRAQLAQAMIARLKDQGGKQSTFGQDQQAKSENAQSEPTRSNEEIDAELRKWEEENAATLPPGYKDFLLAQQSGASGQQALEGKIGNLERVLMAVLSRSQGVADAARQSQEQTQTREISAAQQSINNNIDRAQMALQLPDEAANDFMIFAAERGYTMEDFLSPQLTHQVMSDFKNSMNSPEMERLRAMAQRRQAYTGSMGSSPSAGGETPVESPADSRLNQMVDDVMSRRQQ